VLIEVGRNWLKGSLRLGHAVVKRWVVVGSKVDGGDEKRF
jgi:hypothetical protein